MKWEWFEWANADDNLTIDLAYDAYSYTGILRHGALYNSLSGGTVYGEIQPTAPGYVFDNYGEAYSGKLRDGIMATFIKTLEWELQN